jgi:hypothetical protein
MAGLPFTTAIVDESETTFDASHLREDLVVLDMSLSQDEGDFAVLTLEVVNPRVGLLAPGRPRWLWFAFNPNAANDESSDDAFADTVPMFFGRIVGVPEDLTDATIRVTYQGRPANYEASKASLASGLKELPYYDGVWFSLDDQANPDNVLEARTALWHIDPVTHAVTVSDIVNGEDGTITLDDSIAFAGSLKMSYGDAPARQVQMTATVTWDQKAAGSVEIYGPQTTFGGIPTFESFSGQGVIDSWPEPGHNLKGGWEVAAGSFIERVDPNGPDTWSWSFFLEYFGKANLGKVLTVPEWAFEQTVLATRMPAHVFSIKRWMYRAFLAASYDITRGRTETIGFTLNADTQDVLTDDTAGQPIVLNMSSSEVMDVVNVDSSGNLDIPLSRPSARTYFATDRGNQSIQYLLMVARARLIAAARCVDVTFEVPFRFALEHAVSLRKSAIISAPALPGGIAGGKIKHYEYTANGDNGDLNCLITIGCTVGRGGTITAVEGTPTYVTAGYVDKGYQRYDGEFVLPASGDVAYGTIGGLAPPDDGIDFDHLGPSQALLQRFTMTNLADDQEDGIGVTASEPAEVYARVNAKPTTFKFQLRPINSGPFQWALFVDTTALVIPKTIDLEADGESSS